MNPLEVVLIFVVIPIGVLGLLAATTVLRGSGRRARYRTGDDWNHEPLWWMGNPKGSQVPEPVVDAVASGPSGAAAHRTARGGARGTW